MSAAGFVHSLLETGRVRVPADPEPPRDISEAVAALDAAARPEMAYSPPALSAAAAGWALTLIYRAAQALVFREIEADVVRHALFRPCPEPPSPSGI